MSKKNLYSIWDKKAEEFAPPFIAKNDAMASRMFIHSVKNLPYLDDMQLFHIGFFETENLTSPIVSFDTTRLVPVDLHGDVDE